VRREREKERKGSYWKFQTSKKKKKKKKEEKACLEDSRVVLREGLGLLELILFHINSKSRSGRSGSREKRREDIGEW